jgi:tetratricopeptide (TPR) repeat protein
MPGSVARSNQARWRKPDVAEFKTMPDGGRATPTPRFARTAADLLHKGEIQEALALCLAGTELFPRYATGHLMLGRVYDALGRTAEAMMEYRNVGEAFPDNPVLVGLYQAAKLKEDEAYEDFARMQSETLQGRLKHSTFDDYLSTREEAPVQEESPEPDAVAIEEPLPPAEPSADKGNASTDVDQIIQKLEEAPRRITPSMDQPPPPPAAGPDHNGRIITATLAEIYASQGEYDEAIQAYRTLAEQRPGSASRYLQRLAEIERLKGSLDTRRESTRE